MTMSDVRERRAIKPTGKGWRVGTSDVRGLLIGDGQLMAQPRRGQYDIHVDGEVPSNPTPAVSGEDMWVRNIPVRRSTPHEKAYDRPPT